MENSPTHHPIEHNQRVIYDVELENTLNNMTTNTGFLKTYNDRERGWMGNGNPIKVLRGTEVEINDKNFNVTPNLQKVFTQTSIIPLKKLNDQEWEIYKNILETYNLENIHLNLEKINQVDTKLQKPSSETIWEAKEIKKLSNHLI